MRLLGDGDFRDRLPFLLMFLGSCVLVYAFAAKRYPPLYSAITLLLPAALGTFLYASEMRAYSFMLFFAALMLFCWQRIDAPATRRAALIGLWFAFAGAVLSHVFAIFLFVPFAAGELTRALLRKRLDKAASAVLLTAPFALLLLLPSMLQAHRYYGGVFWSRPTLAGALDAYGTSFLGDSALFLAFVSVLVTLFLVRARPATVPTPAGTQGFTLPEWVLVLTLALLPLYAFIGSLVIKVFVTRYTIPFVLGLELVFVGFLAWSSRFSRAVALCILVLVAGVAVVKQRKPILFALHGFRPNPAQQFRNQSWMDAACATGLPVLASSPHDYMLWHHYGSPCLLAHLHYAITPAIIARSQDDLNMQLFQRGLPLSIVNFESFAASHPEFLLADAQPESPWLLPYLQSPQGKSRFTATPLSSSPTPSRSRTVASPPIV